MKKFFVIFSVNVLFIFVFGVPAPHGDAATLQERLRGKILLQIESKGEAWYIHSETGERYSLGRPHDAFELMRALGLGISNKDLIRVFGALPTESDRILLTKDVKLAKRLAGKILIQIEEKGQAYYLNPSDGKGYFLGRPSDAFDVMQRVGLGIANRDLERIAERKTGEKSGTVSASGKQGASQAQGSQGSSSRPSPGSSSTVFGTPGVSGGGGGGGGGGGAAGAPPVIHAPEEKKEEKKQEAKATETFDRDTTFDNDYVVEKQSRLLVRDGATLTFKKDLMVRGVLLCSGGPLRLMVQGDLTVEGALQCNRSDKDLQENDLGLGLSVVVLGDVTILPSAYIVSNASVVFVDSADLLPKTIDDMTALFADAAKAEKTGVGIGPLIPEEDKLSETAVYSVAQAVIVPPVIANIGGTQYVGDPDATIPPGANVQVQKPPKGIRQIVLVYKFGRATMQLDFELHGPPAQDGTDVEGPCEIDIPALEAGRNLKEQRDNSNDAMRLLARAPNIEVRNFTYYAPDGGRGGHATTAKDCNPGIAKAGHGGMSGNLKMMATKSFRITGDFVIYPGKGGDGGIAKAYGKKGQGCDDRGGSAIAVGGDGASNVKVLRVQGDVDGVEKVKIGSLVGGNGGNAFAYPGQGGDCSVCGGKGGVAGKGTATGGDGGDAVLTLTSGAKIAKRVRGAEERGGNGGNATTGGERGGNTKNCPCGSAGNGGKGGDAEATAGTPGAAKKQGKAGTVAYPGGNGGNGGDGEDPGVGGAAGIGAPPGKKGSDGKPIGCTDPSIGDKPLGFFEFLDIDDNWKPTDAFRVPGWTHIIIASKGTPDIRTHLPITMSLTIDGKTTWNTTIGNDPVSNCRGATGCSIDGPRLVSFEEQAVQKRVVLQAWGKNGGLLAEYNNYELVDLPR